MAMTSRECLYEAKRWSQGRTITRYRGQRWDCLAELARPAGPGLYVPLARGTEDCPNDPEPGKEYCYGCVMECRALPPTGPRFAV
ncbi:hypothetical protein DEI95_08240 [Curtobacterium sp. MCBD17_008]|nr:hypothetical protein DEI95_08240 [Curtobacterium sp. MCBD17_008]